MANGHADAAPVLEFAYCFANSRSISSRMRTTNFQRLSVAGMASRRSIARANSAVRCAGLASASANNVRA